MPYIVREHWEERNLGDELLMADLGIFLKNVEYVNNQMNGYIKHTNLPFVY
jgi:hypothetical protein